VTICYDTVYLTCTVMDAESGDDDKDRLT